MARTVPFDQVLCYDPCAHRFLLKLGVYAPPINFYIWRGVRTVKKKSISTDCSIPTWWSCNHQCVSLRRDGDPRVELCGNQRHQDSGVTQPSSAEALSDGDMALI